MAGYLSMQVATSYTVCIMYVCVRMCVYSLQCLSVLPIRLTAQCGLIKYTNDWALTKNDT